MLPLSPHRHSVEASAIGPGRLREPCHSVEGPATALPCRPQRPREPLPLLHITAFTHDQMLIREAGDYNSN